MEVITIDSQAYKELVSKINAIAKFVVDHQDDDTANPDEMWVDSYEVCTFLKISERTLQRLRSKRLISYSIISGKSYYTIAEVKRMLSEKRIRSTDECMNDLVSIPNPPLYRLKKNGLGVTSLSKSVLSLFDLVLWEQFFPVYWSLQGRYFFECGSQPCVRIHTGLQAASQQRIEYAVVLCTAVIA